MKIGSILFGLFCRSLPSRSFDAFPETHYASAVFQMISCLLMSTPPLPSPTPALELPKTTSTSIYLTSVIAASCYCIDNPLHFAWWSKFAFPI